MAKKIKYTLSAENIFELKDDSYGDVNITDDEILKIEYENVSMMEIDDLFPVKTQKITIEIINDDKEV